MNKKRAAALAYWASGALQVTLAVAACSSGTQTAGGEIHDPKSSITAVSTSEAETPAFRVTATATVAAEPAPFSGRTAEEEVQAAIAAAKRQANGALDDCVPRTDPPPRPCVIHPKDTDSPERGIVVLAIGDGRGTGVTSVLGRDDAGGWKFWFKTQAISYHALRMPSEMRVCADGDTVLVRSTPDVSSPVVGSLGPDAVTTAEMFLFTGSQSGVPTGGYGWYLISGALSGYVRADLLSVNAEPDCSLRNQQVGAR